MAADAQTQTPTSDAASLHPERLRLDLQLCFALYSASSAVIGLYRPLLDGLGITYPQYLVLLVLWEDSPQSISSLGKRLGLDSGTLTPLCKRLEKAGVVTRTRDLDDERRVLIGLTEKGREMKAQAWNFPVAIFEQIPLELEELRSLRASLIRISDGLRGVRDVT